MKKLFLILTVAFVTNIAVAQTPEIVIVQFKSDCRYAEPTWTAYDCYYRAEYMDKQNNTLRAIVYDKAGYAVCNDWKMDNGYPVRISDYYKANYPNESFAVWSSLDEKDHQRYYIIRNSEKIWFDRNGKVKGLPCEKV